MARTAVSARKNEARKGKRKHDINDAEPQPTKKRATTSSKNNTDTQGNPSDDDEEGGVGVAQVNAVPSEDAVKSQEKPLPPAKSKPKTTSVDPAIAMMDPSLLADHCAKNVKRYFGDSTSIELDEKYLPAKAFRDTTTFDQPHSDDNLPAFLMKYTHGGKSTLRTVETLASPHTMVVAQSGIRTADLSRALRMFNKEGSIVAKFVTKHEKMQDNVKMLNKFKIGIVISTPARLKALLDEGAMKLDNLQRVVVDGSFKTEKNMSIFDSKQVFEPMLDLLNLKELRARYGNETEIMVF